MVCLYRATAGEWQSRVAIHVQVSSARVRVTAYPRIGGQTWSTKIWSANHQQLSVPDLSQDVPFLYWRTLAFRACHRADQLTEFNPLCTQLCWWKLLHAENQEAPVPQRQHTSSPQSKKHNNDNIIITYDSWWPLQYHGSRRTVVQKCLWKMSKENSVNSLQSVHHVCLHADGIWLVVCFTNWI